jgi:hypothetical protein
MNPNKLRILALAAGGVLIVAASVSAQGLGAVAKAEESRRKTTASGKAYTNENLPTVEPASAASSRPVAAATPAPETPDQAAKPETSAQGTAADKKAAEAKAAEAKAGDAKAGKKDEAYWRKRIQAERDALARAESFATALQSRINALSTDFVNRDDPAQRNQIGADRQKALAELDRVKKEIVDHNKAIAEIQQEARREKVPAGWVR